MLPDWSDVGSDMPVPISLPGRAPVVGLAPGGTHPGGTVAAGWAKTGGAMPNSNTARVRLRTRNAASPGGQTGGLSMSRIGNHSEAAATPADRHGAGPQRYERG